jgi:hypothetical protein
MHGLAFAFRSDSRRSWKHCKEFGPRTNLGNGCLAHLGSRTSRERGRDTWCGHRVRYRKVMEPRGSRSIIQVVARQPRRFGDDDLRRSCDSFIPHMSVTPASAPSSTIGSGTRCDRAVSFRRGIVEGVRAPPEHHGDDSKPSPELAAVRKIPVIPRRRNEPVKSLGRTSLDDRKDRRRYWRVKILALSCNECQR